MKNKNQLTGLFIAFIAIISAVFYLWWLLLSPDDLRIWAIRIPLIIIAMAILGVITWIGYTMYNTPPQN